MKNSGGPLMLATVDLEQEVVTSAMALAYYV